MKVKTVHFGELDIEAADVLEFDRGPIPFVDFRRYVLLSWEDEKPFQWLQSVDVPHLAFVTLSVPAVFPEVHPTLKAEDRKWLCLAEEEEPMWLAIVVIKDADGGERQGPAITANLLAPIAVNMRARRAMQVIQELETSWARRPVQVAD
jgi:flagellar assembly factor FliW